MSEETNIGQPGAAAPENPGQASDQGTENNTGQQGQSDPKQTQPSAEQLQRELEQARQQAQQLSENYKHLQGAYTRNQQALAQIVGANPPNLPQAAPYEKYVELYKGKGFKEKDARDLAEVAYTMSQEMVAPVMEQLKGAQAMHTVSQTVEQMSQMPQFAMYMADPSVRNYTQQILAANAQQGIPASMEVAQAAVAQALGFKKMQAASNPMQNNQQQQPMQFNGTTWNSGPGYRMPSNPQQNQVQLSPQMMQIEAELKQRIEKLKNNK